MTLNLRKYVDQERQNTFSSKRENILKSMEFATLWTLIWHITGVFQYLPHSYVLFQFRIGVNTFWCCTEKQYRCQATAIQNRNIITPGAARHNHTPRVVQQDTAKTVKITPTVETQINR